MAKFQVVVLGCTGGPFESNLSSYFLIDLEKKEGILLDCGTLLHGLKIAFEKGVFKNFDLEDKELNPLGVLLLRHIKAYLITHVHLDHIGALVAASPVDAKKPILATDTTIDLLHEHIFNDKIWPNYAEESTRGHYQYIRLKMGVKTSIPATRFNVESFLLTHSKTLRSSAFLVECDNDYVLYFGDTSSDYLEKEKNNEIIWKKVAPLIKEKRLKAIFLECSYPNISDEHALYGHLTPKLFLKELNHLASFADSLEGLKVVVTHRKEALTKNDPKVQIAEELNKGNNLGLELIFPEQGMTFFC